MAEIICGRDVSATLRKLSTLIHIQMSLNKQYQ